MHSGDGVALACVLLQDRFGLDVNLLLFAAHVGVTAPLTPPTLVAATEAIRQWHDEVVRPLRVVRRRLTSGPPPAPNQSTAELRDELKGLEIRAELIELDVLDAMVPDAEPQTGDPLSRVQAALILVVRALSDRPLEADEVAALDTIAAAAARVGST